MKIVHLKLIRNSTILFISLLALSVFLTGCGDGYQVVRPWDVYVDRYFTEANTRGWELQNPNFKYGVGFGDSSKCDPTENRGQISIPEWDAGDDLSRELLVFIVMNCGANLHAGSDSLDADYKNLLPSYISDRTTVLDNYFFKK